MLHQRWTSSTSNTSGKRSSDAPWIVRRQAAVSRCPGTTLTVSRFALHWCSALPWVLVLGCRYDAYMHDRHHGQFIYLVSPKAAIHPHAPAHGSASDHAAHTPVRTADATAESHTVEKAGPNDEVPSICRYPHLHAHSTTSESKGGSRASLSGWITGFRGLAFADLPIQHATAAAPASDSDQSSEPSTVCIPFTGWICGAYRPDRMKAISELLPPLRLGARPAVKPNGPTGRPEQNGPEKGRRASADRPCTVPDFLSQSSTRTTASPSPTVPYEPLLPHPRPLPRPRPGPRPHRLHVVSLLVVADVLTRLQPCVRWPSVRARNRHPLITHRVHPPSRHRAPCRGRSGTNTTPPTSTSRCMMSAPGARTALGRDTHFRRVTPPPSLL